ncbi:MAG TPA: NADH-quinone oxidoreductase subunit J [Acidimicrobiales bacterium]
MSASLSILAQANPDGDELFVAQNIFFAIIAAVMVVSALRVVTTKNVVHAALYLVIVLAGVAAQFLLLGAEFVGITQVLVYIGAIIVLFLFGIMLTRARLGEDESVRAERRIMASIVGVLLFVVMAAALVDDFEDTHVDVAEPSTTAQVSDSLLSQYLIPFEVVGMLLLAALIGAIVVARKD